MRDTAAHFTKMSQLFTLAAKDGVRAAFSIPDEMKEERLISGYLNEIENLTLRLRKNEEDLDSVKRELKASNDTIKGYQDSVVLAPHQVVDFPQQLRNNVRRILDRL